MLASKCNRTKEFSPLIRHSDLLAPDFQVLHFFFFFWFCLDPSRSLQRQKANLTRGSVGAPRTGSARSHWLCNILFEVAHTCQRRVKASDIALSCAAPWMRQGNELSASSVPQRHIVPHFCQSNRCFARSPCQSRLLGRRRKKKKVCPLLRI